MTRARGAPPENLLWRARISTGGRQREMLCTFEQLGEECYELRISLGGGPLVSETFGTTEDLLGKAEELRLALVPRHGRSHTAGVRAVRRVTRH